MDGMFSILCFFLILYPFAAGLACWAVGRCGGAARDRLAQLSGMLVFLGCLALGRCLEGQLALPGVLGLGLSFRLDGLRLVLVCLAGFLWMMTTLFAPDYLAHAHNKNRYYLFLFFTLGSILGVFLSADLYTILVFFEIMSLSSWVLVIQEETPGAIKAADSYLAFAVIGGLSTLMGLFLLYHLLGTLTITELAAAAAGVENKALLYLAGAFTLGGFAAKAGMFPLHTWLPAAHPVAPAPASALLSGIITKAGMYGIFVLAAQLFLHDAQWGMAMLLFGVITMVTGAVLGVLSVDLKRTLACSSMSQIGFILVGVGMQGLLGEENALAVWGSVLHVMNHSLIKLCLFMCAGVVVMNLHKLDLNDIRGFGRGKPALMVAFLLGALGIGGVPGFGGYISKTLLHESIVEYITELEHLGESAGLFHAIDYMNKLSTVVLLASGLLMPVLGLTAHMTMDRVAALAQGFFGSEGPEHAIAYFSLTNLKGAAISLAIGAAVYLLIVRTLLVRDGKYLNRLPRVLDLENSLYRPVLLKVLPFVGAFVARVVGSVMEWCIAACNGVLMWRATPTITPRSDDAFCAYEPHSKRLPGFTSSLSFGLMLFGFGLVSILVCVVLGVTVEFLAYRPLRQAPPLSVLITAIGVSYLLQNLALLIFGSEQKATPTIFKLPTIELGGVYIDGITLITLVVTAIIMIALTLFIGKTRMGKAMRAVSEDKGAAELMGISVNRTITITFAIGSALAAVAALFYGMSYIYIRPTTGSMPGIKAFTAAVFGGIGSIPGAMLGGILMGIIEQLSKTYISTLWSDAIVFGVLVLVLVVKPTGLLGKKISEKV